MRTRSMTSPIRGASRPCTCVAQRWTARRRLDAGNRSAISAAHCAIPVRKPREAAKVGAAQCAALIAPYGASVSGHKGTITSPMLLHHPGAELVHHPLLHVALGRIL